VNGVRINGSVLRSLTASAANSMAHPRRRRDKSHPQRQCRWSKRGPVAYLSHDVGSVRLSAPPPDKARQISWAVATLPETFPQFIANLAKSWRSCSLARLWIPAVWRGTVRLVAKGQESFALLITAGNQSVRLGLGRYLVRLDIFLAETTPSGIGDEFEGRAAGVRGVFASGNKIQVPHPRNEAAAGAI